MKKVLILGATSAIAENCARIWASMGYELYLVARNKERVMTIATDLKIRGAIDVRTNCFDLNNLDKHISLLGEAEKVLEKVDIVLIAHGTLPDQKFCECSVEETITEIQTNAISTVSLLTHIANRFEKRKSGTIAVISSVAGDRGRASNYIYGSAKAMVSEFSSGLRQRLHKSNVSVVTIKPGFVDTPMTSEFKKGFLWAKPDKVAARIVKSINARKAVIYVPGFWRVIMAIIRNIPNNIFNKLDL